MAENEKTDIKELKTEEQSPTKILMVFYKKIWKDLVTEIYFDKQSKETFPDKLFKVIQAKGNYGD